MNIKKHIPNSITCLNLLCGVLGIIATMEFKNFQAAFLLMIAAAMFDFMDGLVARAIGAYSEIGKELDSLADMISFGVLPSLMLYKTMGNQTYVCVFPLLIAVFSGLRLAKFNVDERQHESFIGLATPACAMICGSLASLADLRPDSLIASWCHTQVFIPALAVVLSGLLISEIPMFSMKFTKSTLENRLTGIKRITFVTVVAILFVVEIFSGLAWPALILTTFTTYILMNIVFLIFPSTRQ